MVAWIGVKSQRRLNRRDYMLILIPKRVIDMFHQHGQIKSYVKFKCHDVPVRVLVPDSSPATAAGHRCDCRVLSILLIEVD
jgi:hypothetical protein